MKTYCYTKVAHFPADRCHTSFLSFSNYINSIFEDLGFQKELFKQSVNTSQLGELEAGIEKTICVMYSDAEGNDGLEIRQSKDRKLILQKLVSGALNTT